MSNYLREMSSYFREMSNYFREMSNYYYAGKPVPGSSEIPGLGDILQRVTGRPP